MLAGRDSRPAKGGRGARAFTLIELTLVLVLVGLITTMALFNVDAFLPETRIAGAAREIGAALRSTRTLAWTRGQPYWFVYDLGEMRFRTISPFLPGEEPLRLAEDPDERETFSWKELDAKDLELEVWFPDGRQLRGTAEPFEIRFDPRGTFPYHYVIFIDRSDPNALHPPTYTLEVRGLTGEVEFYTGVPTIDVPSDADFVD